MLSENLNKLVSDLSCHLKTCDIHKIAAECMRVANTARIDDFHPGDYVIEDILEKIAAEPLHDKLSLNPGVFAAQNEILSRRLRQLNLKRLRDEQLRHTGGATLKQRR